MFSGASDGDQTLEEVLPGASLPSSLTDPDPGGARRALPDPAHPHGSNSVTFVFEAHMAVHRRDHLEEGSPWLFDTGLEGGSCAKGFLKALGAERYNIIKSEVKTFGSIKMFIFTGPRKQKAGLYCPRRSLPPKANSPLLDWGLQARHRPPQIS